ncbi:endo alpha-1,4 polygalactosaminidase [Streptomyces sp. NBC_00059]|uniref:endo alpha-1,4 polygalactosaminidase n=1 Tax=Streptomyces sp. NBC_00059 TaxID=2975635 RepID=UPI00225881C5|nr:endo alpha-1,4 polygalactosaminidase [Streptomyces sp. NBC_00059]MCX5416199.1 endo alpha-1,4 polygalactosaminidase [Streptomyces sp. NBC_00059]
MAARDLPPLPGRRRTAGGVAALVAAVLGASVLSGCAVEDGPSRDAAAEKSPASRDAAESGVLLPTAGMAFDYQIGGGYTPSDGVRAVSRDREDEPAPGLYNVCYVNAFQTQPGALDWWQDTHPDLLLADDEGEPVIDEGWDEVLLDTSTAAKREQLAEIVGEWIDGCAESGFQAVEPDNLDSFERSDGRLTKAHNEAFARTLAERAHGDGLAIGQKNTTDLLDRHSVIGFDFAVTEECAQFDECDAYADAYDGRVFAIEYEGEGDVGFDESCSAWGDRISLVLRDLDVLPEGEKGHVFRLC